MDMDPHNLAGVCDRSSADVRGVKTGGTGSGASSRRTTTEQGKIPAARRGTAENAAAAGALSGAVKNMKI